MVMDVGVAEVAMVVVVVIVTTTMVMVPRLKSLSLNHQSFVVTMKFVLSFCPATRPSGVVPARRCGKDSTATA